MMLVKVIEMQLHLGSLNPETLSPKTLMFLV